MTAPKLCRNISPKKLRADGIDAVLADITEADEGEIAEQLIDAAGVVFGTSMVLTGPHPKTPYVAMLANILRAKMKFYAVIGSFGWGGNLTGAIDSSFTFIKPKKLDDVIVKGRPLPDDFQKLDALAASICSML